MRKTSLDDQLRLALDREQVARLGYCPGAVVVVSTLSSGSLLVTLDDSVPVDLDERRAIEIQRRAQVRSRGDDGRYLPNGTEGAAMSAPTA